MNFVSRLVQEGTVNMIMHEYQYFYIKEELVQIFVIILTDLQGHGLISVVEAANKTFKKYTVVCYSHTRKIRILSTGAYFRN